MKTEILNKFEQILVDIKQAKLEKDEEKVTWFYANATGFLSVVFELPEFTQSDYDDLCNRLDSVVF